MAKKPLDDEDDDRTRVVERTAEPDGGVEDDDRTRLVERSAASVEDDDRTRLVERTGVDDDDDRTRVVAREDDEHTRVVRRDGDGGDRTVVVGRGQKKAAEPSLTLPSSGRRRRGIAAPPVTDSFAPPAIEAIGPGAVQTYEPRAITEPPAAHVPTTGAAPTRDVTAALPSVRRRGLRDARLALWGFWAAVAGAAIGAGLIIWGVLRLI